MRKEIQIICVGNPEFGDCGEALTLSTEHEIVCPVCGTSYTAECARRQAVRQDSDKGEGLKVALNSCYGRFDLSQRAYELLGWEWRSFPPQEKSIRTNPRLIHVIEQLGTEAASGDHARLRIEEVNHDFDWKIRDHDGQEKIIITA